MTSTSFGVLSVPGTRMVVYNPVNKACRTAIGKLLASQGTDAEYPCAPAHAPAPRRTSRRLRRDQLAGQRAGCVIPLGGAPDGRLSAVAPHDPARAAIIIPGIRYTADAPLLMYARLAVCSAP